MRNGKDDFRKTAEIYVDAIRGGELARDRAIEEVAHELACAAEFERGRITEWLRRRARTHSDGPLASVRLALRDYLKRVRAR